ncbi:MAG: BPTI/Kunitz domain-containing protein [Nannocystaceae bacterium]
MNLSSMHPQTSPSRRARAALFALVTPALVALVACSGGKLGDSDTDPSASSTGTATDPTGTATDPSATDPSATDPSATGTTDEPETTGASDDRCQQVPEGGSCDAAFEKWAFDPVSGRCYSWIYGGCDGVVPFDDLETCQTQCEPCDAFFDGGAPAPSVEAVPITIRNDSGADAWIQAYTLGGGAVGFRWQVIEISPFGADEALVTNPNWCDYPCSDYQKNDECLVYCTDGGPEPPPIYLAPGGTYTYAWSGQHFGEVALPDHCIPQACMEDYEHVACDRWKNAPIGEYEAKAIVGAAIQCEGPECSCTPNAEGWCQLEAPLSAPIEAPWTITSLVSLPGSMVELVIEP